MQQLFVILIAEIIDESANDCFDFCKPRLRKKI